MSDAPFVLALDISKTLTGVAEGRVGEKPRAYSLPGKDLSVVAAQAQLFDWLVDRTKADKIDLLGYEAPLDAGAFRPIVDWEEHTVRSQRDPHTTLVLAKMTGVVELVGFKRKLRTESINVMTARKEFVGQARFKGDEGKKRVRAMVAHLGWTATNYDQSDAECIWHYCCVLADRNRATIITPSMHARVATQCGAKTDEPLLRRVRA